MEGSATQDCYDWYIDRPSMVHLRRLQGGHAHAPTTTTRNARIVEKEVGRPSLNRWGVVTR